MKRLILLALILSLLSLASEKDNNNSEGMPCIDRNNTIADSNRTKDINASQSSKNIREKQLKKAIEDEEKYAREQKFYTEEDYDFEGAKVNKKSLDAIPEIKMDPPEIDSESILGMD